MDLKDHIAWSVIVLFYILAGVPFIGSWATKLNSTYTEGWLAGIKINFILAVVVLDLFFVGWSFIQILRSLV